MKKIDSTTLKAAQAKMLEILVEVDAICRKNNISYWLETGTLLGAIRHEGFIPWDDDIDIGMLRSDFEKFLKVVQKQLPQNLFLQTPFTDPFYYKHTIPCKIRLNNTYFKEADELNISQKHKKAHCGIFIDVFPLDYYSKNSFVRSKIERLIVKFFYLKTISVYIKNHSRIRSILSKFTKIIPWKLLYKLKNFQLSLMNKNTKNRLLGFGIELPLEMGFNSENDLFPLKEIFFEGKKFFIPNNYHHWLVTRYGVDYMTPPEPKDRQWHALEVKIGEE